jgi:hypothetical protein
MKNWETLQKSILSLLLFLISTSIIQAQNQQGLDLVQVKVISSGKTEALAVTEALRSALTQTSSVFISSNTTLINDELAKDQISMINNGSIAEFKIIDKALKDDGTVFLTCDVTVSVNKLGSFVESVGGSTELKGGLFASNIKIMELNEKAEAQAVHDLLLVSRQMLSTSFDYSIVNGEPVNNNGMWSVPLTVEIKKNKNYQVFCDFFYSSLKNIQLSTSEIEAYLKLNKSIYSIGLFDNSKVTLSTPVVSAEDMLVPNTVIDFSYYTKLNGESSGNSAGTYKRTGDTLRTYLGKQEYSTYLKARFKELKKVNYQPNYLKDIYSIQNDVFTASNETNYSHIALRNKYSYDSLYSFILNFSKMIQDAYIDNGFQQMKLSEVNLLDYRSKDKSYILVNLQAHTLPISFYNFQNNWVKFYSDFRNSDMTSLGRPNLSRSGSQRHLQGSKVTFFNSSWEAKMLYKMRTSATKVSFVSLSSIDMKNPDFRELDKTYPYFDYVFASYVKYLYDFEFLQRRLTSKFNSFPLQLTLIGDSEGVVFKAVVNNTLSLEDISRVNKYTLDRNPN